jgi:hypothetical protein
VKHLYDPAPFDQEWIGLYIQRYGFRTDYRFRDVPQDKPSPFARRSVSQEFMLSGSPKPCPKGVPEDHLWTLQERAWERRRAD